MSARPGTFNVPGEQQDKWLMRCGSYTKIPIEKCTMGEKGRNYGKVCGGVQLRKTFEVGK